MKPKDLLEAAQMSHTVSLTYAGMYCTARVEVVVEQALPCRPAGTYFTSGSSA